MKTNKQLKKELKEIKRDIKELLEAQKGFHYTIGELIEEFRKKEPL